MDELIKTLQNKGYEIVPLSSLIYKEGLHMNHEGRQILDAEPEHTEDIENQENV